MAGLWLTILGMTGKEIRRKIFDTTEFKLIQMKMKFREMPNAYVAVQLRRRVNQLYVLMMRCLGEDLLARFFLVLVGT